ncbi:hypothetical protein [Microbispora sp. ATCC PTA-5024]|uniref:hypothetical protein n=1 Tax=Microbispora sp. ATCC PTA-5024 TaxID=316330 RepID=UPI0003DD59C6|nr:hypothetical protein [Microbispora sp. ATCC PTA-5024]ETK31188.1 hypothetical protein MPTA5024_36125 [Microbispora sp. ATCC PTA-5024]
MSTMKNLVGLLAASAALTGGAVALGTAVTSTSASAATVMGGNVGGGRPVARHYVRSYYPVASNRQGQGSKAKNKNKQHQHGRQYQNQRQFLMRDFTLVLTPFQKAENSAASIPWNHQQTDASVHPRNNQQEWTNTKSDPSQYDQADAENNNDPSMHKGGYMGAYPRTGAVAPATVVTPTPTVTVTVTPDAAVPLTAVP